VTRKFAIFFATMLFGAAPATPQSSTMADIIGQTVANSINQGFPAKCYQGTGMFRTTPASFESGSRRSELAMQDYLASATPDAKTSSAFLGRPAVLTVDGVERKGPSARDPFDGRVKRLERVGLIVGHSNNRFRGQWRAFDADGHALGIYDAYLQRAKDRARIITLSIFTAGASAQALPLVPFCDTLGDVELWQKKQAEREAMKAAKRAQQ
jgi:hypothetical protein